MASNNSMDDLLYNELLTTSGYDVESAIGLTYSLDLEAMLSVPLAFGMLGELDDTTRRSPLYLLEAVRKSADKMLVFCTKGQIKVPQYSRTIYSLMEKSVVEVCRKDQPLSNFHPKLWLIKETNREEPYDSQIKIIVLSRNLSFDNSLDIAVTMTGKMEGGRVDFHKQQPLIDMLDELLPFTRAERRQQVKQMMDDLTHVENFDTNDPFEDYDFLPMVVHKKVLNEEVDFATAFQGQQMIIFSPFIDLDTLQWLNARVKDNRQRVLFTRKEWVTFDIFDYYAHHNGEIYIMKDEMKNNDVFPMDLHAKMYYVNMPKCANKNYLFVGSANATRTAFGTGVDSLSSHHINTEFLLRLTYRRSQNRTDNFKAEFVNDAKDCKFELMTTAPSKNATFPAKYTVVEQVMKGAIVNGNFQAQASETGNGVYSVFVKRKVLNDKGCKLSVAPLQFINQKISFTDCAVIERIPLAKLSEFYVLTVADDNDSMDSVIKIPTKGIPDNRDSQIFKSYIDTEEKFLKYVSLMLADNPNESLFDLLETEGNMNGHNRKKDVKAFEPQFYEQMLKIAATHPERLEDIDELISRLDGNNIPAAFNQMYDKFKSIINKLKKL